MERHPTVRRTRHEHRVTWWVVAAWVSILLTAGAGLLGAAGLGP